MIRYTTHDISIIVSILTITWGSIYDPCHEPYSWVNFITTSLFSVTGWNHGFGDITPGHGELFSLVKYYPDHLGHHLPYNMHYMWAVVINAPATWISIESMYLYIPSGNQTLFRFYIRWRFVKNHPFRESLLINQCTRMSRKRRNNSPAIFISR